MGVHPDMFAGLDGLLGLPAKPGFGGLIGGRIASLSAKPGFGGLIGGRIASLSNKPGFGGLIGGV